MLIFPSLFSHLPQTANVKDVSMQYLPTSLTVLKLGGCADLTDEGVKLLERLSSLTTLQISGCEKVHAARRP